MARRTGSNTAVADAPETTDEVAVEETPQSTEAVEAAAEAVAEEPTAETTDEAASEEAAPTGDTPAPQATEAEFDAQPFMQLAAEVVAGHDKSTGALPEGGLERVLDAYRALPDTKARNKVKKLLQEEVGKGIESMDMGTAKGYLTLHDNMKTGGASSGGERKPADPKARWKQALEVATLAYGELYNNRPEGVEQSEADEIVSATASLAEEMGNLRTYLDAPAPAEGEEKPEAPKVDDRVTQAFRLVRGGKVSGGRASTGTSTPHDGPRRDIGKHIQSAFADKASGDFLTVAQIRAHKSEEYGDEAPSAGAISARLFPSSGTCTVEGIIPGTGGEKDQRGARKA